MAKQQDDGPQLIEVKTQVCDAASRLITMTVEYRPTAAYLTVSPYMAWHTRAVMRALEVSNERNVLKFAEVNAQIGNATPHWSCHPNIMDPSACRLLAATQVPTKK